MAVLGYQARAERDVHLRDRLVDLAVETQAQGNRMQAHGGACLGPAAEVLRVAGVLAEAARKLGASTTLNLYFPRTPGGHKQEEDDDEDQP